MPEDKQRIKDAHREHNEKLEGLTENTLAFYNELSTYFPDIRVTSGKRSASQKVGKHSNHSHHNTGNALDIGAENYQVYNFLMNDRRGLELLNKYGMGAYDETNPENLKKTGGTGPHVHLGSDSQLVKVAKQRLQNFDKITPVYAYIDKEHKTPEVTAPQSSTQQLSQQYLDQYSQQYTPIQIESAVVTPVSFDIQSFQEDVEKEKIKEQKIEESPARQRLEEKRNERDAILGAFNQVQYDVPTAQNNGQEQAFNISEIEFMPVQESLPGLPNIFAFPTT